VIHRSSGKSSGANARGQWLVAACTLRCCSGLLEKLPALEQAPQTALKLFASVPSLSGLALDQHILLISTAESGINCSIVAGGKFDQVLHYRR
jgi:hypothetical protein